VTAGWLAPYARSGGAAGGGHSRWHSRCRAALYSVVSPARIGRSHRSQMKVGSGAGITFVLMGWLQARGGASGPGIDSAENLGTR
jgi:hypothetical protein